ncbi:hypothetical protein DUK53_05690, partial [Listeria sp. SHR_NRA_18]
MKKVISILAIASILGTTVVTPLNVLSTKGYAAEEANSTAAVLSANNPNLLTTSVEIDPTTHRLVHWQSGTTVENAVLVNKGDYWSKIENGWRSNTVPTHSVASTGEGNLTIGSQGSVVNTLVQTIKTEIGKEYTIALDYVQTPINQPSVSNFLFGVRRTNGSIEQTGIAAQNRLAGFTQFTFIADRSETDVFFQLNTAGNVSKSVVFDNLTIGKSSNQLAKEEEKARQEAAEASVKDLFTNGDVTGTIKDTTNQAAIDKAQKVVDAVTDATKKAALQKELDEAKKQLEAKQAAAAAEKARQEAAEASVKDLFTNGDVTGTIKDTTDQ